MDTPLSIPSTVLQGTTPLQRYVMEVLEKWNAVTWKKTSLEDIIFDIADISLTAQKPTPLGDLVDDPVTRLNAKKLLLELMGVYKKGGGTAIQMNFDVWDLLYNWWAKNVIQPSAEVIQ